MSGEFDVLGLIKWDWANSGYRYTKSLKRLGLNVLSFKGTPLAWFNYPEQLPTLQCLSSKETSLFPITNNVNNDEDLKYLLSKAKCLYLFGSQWITGIEIPDHLKVVVQHGGITYRNQPDICNNIFNPITSATINQCPDLMGLGADNEHLIYYPVDTEVIKPDFNFKYGDYSDSGSKLIIGHFPSSPINKGTRTINEVIERLKTYDEFKDRFIYTGVKYNYDRNRHSDHHVDWVKNLDRLESCDIVIETCQRTLKTKEGVEVPFGEWGNTALEGSASGTIVVTNSLTPELYAKEYGECALEIMDGTAEGLEASLVKLLSQSKDEILNRKYEVRKWAVKNHSIEAAALRLWDKVFKDIFPDKWTKETLKQHAIDTWPEEFLKLRGWV
tara:strand:- start:4539 stop:5696 length:1158 start_codon:yes stop_codon:yes gene_type:complete